MASVMDAGQERVTCVEKYHHESAIVEARVSIGQASLLLLVSQALGLEQAIRLNSVDIQLQ